MKLTKSRFKQIIQEELASLAEIEEEEAEGEEEDWPEWTGRDYEEAEDEEQYASEAEYAKIVVRFEEVLDGVLGENEYDLLDELKSIADYAMEHRDRWEAAAPEREEQASQLEDRIAASQEERGVRFPRVA